MPEPRRESPSRRRRLDLFTFVSVYAPVAFITLGCVLMGTQMARDTKGSVVLAFLGGAAGYIAFLVAGIFALLAGISLVGYLGLGLLAASKAVLRFVSLGGFAKRSEGDASDVESP